VSERMPRIKPAPVAARAACRRAASLATQWHDSAGDTRRALIIPAAPSADKLAAACQIPAREREANAAYALMAALRDWPTWPSVAHPR
jgi:hypothetical protein